MVRILAFALAAIAFAADGAGPIPAAAPNCNVASPPAESGETGSHGILIKIYPRRKDIGAGYTGCQTSWVGQQGKWALLSVLYFEAGDLRAWRMPSVETPPPEIFCRFRSFQLEPGSPPQCYVPDPQVIPSPSFAPGCVELAIRTGNLTNECIESLDR